MKLYLWGAVILLLLSACSQDSLFEGISEDSSRDSKIEQARMDLDNSNYGQVISDLSVIYTTSALDTEVSQLLASAYMGKVGIDLTLFIANSTSSGLEPFDIAASMIQPPNENIQNGRRFIGHDDDDGQTDALIVLDLLDYITKAKETLSILEKKGLSTDDHRIQLGIASAVHFILNTSNTVADAFNTSLYLPDVSKHNPGTIPVPINSSAYIYLKNEKYGYSWPTLVIPAIFSEKVTNGTPTWYQEDLLNINHAITAFSRAYPESNKMRDALTAFLSSALGEETGVQITDELIMTYTSEGLNSFVYNLAMP